MRQTPSQLCCWYPCYPLELLYSLCFNSFFSLVFFFYQSTRMFCNPKLARLQIKETYFGFTSIFFSGQLLKYSWCMDITNKNIFANWKKERIGGGPKRSLASNSSTLGWPERRRYGDWVHCSGTSQQRNTFCSVLSLHNSENSLPLQTKCIDTSQFGTGSILINALYSLGHSVILYITSPGKVQILKAKFQFLLNTYLIHIVKKLKKLEV